MSEQLSFTDAGLPRAFADRWRELGGPAVAGESCILAHGTWWLLVRVTSTGRVYAMHTSGDTAPLADELLALVRR